LSDHTAAHTISAIDTLFVWLCMKLQNCGAQGQCMGVESCTILFLGRHFLFTFAAGCIV